MGKWKLFIHFDSLAIQENRDPELAFPNDEHSQTVSKLMSIWGGLPEEFLEDATLENNTITVEFDVLDSIYGFHEWLLSNTIPRFVSLTRS